MQRLIRIQNQHNLNSRLVIYFDVVNTKNNHLLFKNTHLKLRKIKFYNHLDVVVTVALPWKHLLIKQFRFSDTKGI